MHPDEDCKYAEFIDEEKLDEILDDPVGYMGIKHFISGEEFEAMEKKNGHDPIDPQYWEEGHCLLLEYTVLEVKPVVTKYQVV